MKNNHNTTKMQNVFVCSFYHHIEKRDRDREIRPIHHQDRSGRPLPGPLGPGANTHTGQAGAKKANACQCLHCLKAPGLHSSPGHVTTFFHDYHHHPNPVSRFSHRSMPDPGSRERRDRLPLFHCHWDGWATKQQTRRTEKGITKTRNNRTKTQNKE